MICRMTGIICPYANENGYCDSTVCHNMNIVGNIIPKERPENISNSSIWVKHQSNWHTGIPTEEGLYVVAYRFGNKIEHEVREMFYSPDYGMTFGIKKDIVAWMPITPYDEEN